MNTTAVMAKRSKDPTSPVRIKDDLARKAAQICARKGIGTAEFLDSIIRPFVEEEYVSMAKDIADEIKASRSKRPPP